jgi:hypothetical protein
MFDKAFGEIDKAYIESLIEDEVVEAKHLDYKETLPGDTDREKNRFVEDICAFANAAGGDIFFGLGERKDTPGQKTGTPVYVGLKGVNFDQEKLRLEHIILNKIEPRISGIQFRVVEGFADGPVLVVRIPRSYNAPHMTKHDGRFRSRIDGGNYAMDVQQIRSAFVASEALPERIRRFRGERLAQIVAGETPVPLPNTPKIVLHLVPISSFAEKKAYDVRLARQGTTTLMPMEEVSSVSHRYNLDGLLSYVRPADGVPAWTYAQLFSDGRIEAVNASWIQNSRDKRTLGRGFETLVVDKMNLYLANQQALGVEPPILAMLSFLGVRGCVIGGADTPWRHEDEVDRDDLIINEVVVEEFEIAAEQLMRPAFDAVWMACGWPGSRNYDEDGNWKPPR